MAWVPSVHPGSRANRAQILLGDADRMENGSYLAKAFKMIPNRFLLVKVAAERVQQLNKGAKPLVEIGPDSMSLSEIALKEIAEGKIQIELPPKAKTKKG